MSSHSLIRSRKLLAACCGVGLAVGILAIRAQADPWDKKTILTVDKTIQVQDRVLPAGTYVLKLLDSSSNRHVVQIFNEDQSHIIDTVMAIPNYRLQPAGHSRFMFWETPPGAAPALRAWFYPGDNFGQEFRYPKHLAMLQTVQQSDESSRLKQQAEAAEPAPAPAPVKQEEPVTNETAAAPAPPEQPVEIAQNTPPPAPEPPVETAQATPPPPAETPTQLPKTASPYPLIGLGGMFSLALSGLLRLKRQA